VVEIFADVFSLETALPFVTELRVRHAELRGQKLSHERAEVLASVILQILQAREEDLPTLEAMLDRVTKRAKFKVVNGGKRGEQQKH